jgi:hypothetical protein
MKNLILAAAIVASAAIPAAAQTSVSVTIGQPDFYGRIDIGGYPAPPVFVSQPIIIEREVRYIAEPVYLRVPPGHRKNWSKHCARYDACGRPVYFVRDDWYLNEYAPQYRERHSDHGKGNKHHEKRGKEHGKGKKDDHGRGHGKGH